MDDTPIKENIAEETKKSAIVRKDKYFEAVGRRKSASARVRLFTKNKAITVNGKSLNDYFTIARFQKEAVSPLEKMKIADKLGAIIKVSGGGIMAQSEAIKLGIARALIKFNPIFRKRLRRLGLLTRDPRAVERKKPGLKKARRAPQWRKR
ncbi:MAG: 30S ribosomal protein S9 [Patescibacteria group bacterium]|nr:30S ribosomal protein S9 [Patescibacteria group bacterium]